MPLELIFPTPQQSRWASAYRAVGQIILFLLSDCRKWLFPITPMSFFRWLFTCANGKAITFDGIKKTTSQSGFKMETSVYSCKDCAGCPMKGKCIRACGSKKPLEERNKVIYVSKRFARQRETMEERISTYEGKLIRVNRSIQAEGVFAMTKEDMGFRRFLLRSAVKVEVEWTLLSLAYNVLKLHHKIQKDRLGTGLVVPTSFPAGL